MFFVLGCFASGDDSDHITTLPKAMTHHENPKPCAHPKQEEALFSLIVFIVIELDSLLIEEHRSRLLKGDAMLSLVLPVLPFIPFEPQIIHNYTVNADQGGVKPGSVFFCPTSTFTLGSQRIRCEA